MSECKCHLTAADASRCIASGYHHNLYSQDDIDRASADAYRAGFDAAREQAANECDDLIARVQQGFMPQFDDIAQGHITAAQTLGVHIRAMQAAKDGAK